MRVLVTGGAGFIGSHLVDKLLADGHKVAVYDILDPQVHGDGSTDVGYSPPPWPDYLDPRAVRFNEDIRNPVMLDHTFEEFEPTVVVHLAAKVGVGQGQYEIADYVDVNATGTARVLEAIAKRHGTKKPVERLVVASSMSCYGEGQYICETHGMVRASTRSDEQLQREMWLPFCGLMGKDRKPCRKTPVPSPIAEWASLRPQGIYAETKRTTEQLALLFGAAYGIPVAALRLFNAYGPRQALGNPYTGVAAIFSAQILAGQRPTIYEDGWQARDFIHVYDVAAAFALMVGPSVRKLARKQWKSPKFSGQFNVGTGEAITVLGLAKLLIEQAGVEMTPEITGRYRSGDIRCCYADRARMQQLGWEPHVLIEDGVAELWDWVAEQSDEERKLQPVAEAELVARGLLQSTSA